MYIMDYNPKSPSFWVFRDETIVFDVNIYGGKIKMLKC